MTWSLADPWSKASPTTTFATLWPNRCNMATQPMISVVSDGSICSGRPFNGDWPCQKENKESDKTGLLTNARLLCTNGVEPDFDLNNGINMFKPRLLKAYPGCRDKRCFWCKWSFHTIRTLIFLSIWLGLSYSFKVSLTLMGQSWTNSFFFMSEKSPDSSELRHSLIKPVFWRDWQSVWPTWTRSLCPSFSPRPAQSVSFQISRRTCRDN